MVGFAADPIPKVRIGIIGLGNRGKTLTQMLYWLISNGMAEIVAMSDLIESNLEEALEGLKAHQQQQPVSYSKDEEDWKNLAKRDDIDLLLIATP